MATKKLSRNGINKLFNNALSIINNKDCINLIEKAFNTVLIINQADALNYINDVLLQIFEDERIVSSFLKYLLINSDSLSKVKVEEENEQIYIKVKELRILYNSILQDIHMRNEYPFMLSSFNISDFYENGQAILSIVRMDGFRGDYLLKHDSLIMILSKLIEYSTDNYITNDKVEINQNDIKDLLNNMNFFMSEVNNKLTKEVAITNINKK